MIKEHWERKTFYLQACMTAELEGSNLFAIAKWWKCSSFSEGRGKVGNKADLTSSWGRWVKVGEKAGFNQTK